MSIHSLVLCFHYSTVQSVAVKPPSKQLWEIIIHKKSDELLRFCHTLRRDQYNVFFQLTWWFQLLLENVVNSGPTSNRKLLFHCSWQICILSEKTPLFKVLSIWTSQTFVIFSKVLILSSLHLPSSLARLASCRALWYENWKYIILKLFH